MNQRTLIEKKDWVYQLYEYDGKLELIIPIPSPAPGFDVFHVLDEREKRAYESHGMSSLQERIEDMNKNYSNYKLQSWR